MDVARAYADFRIVELIQAKIDSLHKPKDHKKDKAVKPQAKLRPAISTSIKEKVYLTYSNTYCICHFFYVVYTYHMDIGLQLLTVVHLLLCTVC